MHASRELRRVAERQRLQAEQRLQMAQRETQTTGRQPQPSAAAAASRSRKRKLHEHAPTPPPLSPPLSQLIRAGEEGKDDEQLSDDDPTLPPPSQSPSAARPLDQRIPSFSYQATFKGRARALPRQGAGRAVVTGKNGRQQQPQQTAQDQTEQRPMVSHSAAPRVALACSSIIHQPSRAAEPKQKKERALPAGAEPVARSSRVEHQSAVPASRVSRAPAAQAAAAIPQQQPPFSRPSSIRLMRPATNIAAAAAAAAAARDAANQAEQHPPLVSSSAQQPAASSPDLASAADVDEERLPNSEPIDGSETEEAGLAQRAGAGCREDDEGECKEEALAARMQTADGPVGSAASSAPVRADSSLAQRQAQLLECAVCFLPYEFIDHASAEWSSRVPRNLPCCGRTVCSACIHDIINSNNGACKCPWRCPDKPLIVNAVTDFPKAIDFIKFVETSAQHAAETNLKRQPCQHFGAPQRPVACFCDGCQMLMCAQCEKTLHAAPPHSSHERMDLKKKARQQLAAEQEERFCQRDAPGLKEELVAKKKHIEERTSKLKKRIAVLSSNQHRHLTAGQAGLAQVHKAVQQAEIRFERQQQDWIRDVDERKQLESQLSSLQGQIAELLGSDDLEIGKSGQSMLLKCSATLIELIQLKHERMFVEPLLCRWVIDLLQLQSFDSSILQPDHAHDLCRILSDVGLYEPRRLYRATRDGFSAATLWRCCAGKGPTLTVVKVADNDFVCGAYTPVSWPADAATRTGFVADPSGRTFLFSLANAHGRAVKLRLKSAVRGAALNFYNNCGPGFGTHGDLCLIDNRHRKDLQKAECSALSPASFVVDRAAEAATRSDQPRLPSGFCLYHALSAAGPNQRGDMILMPNGAWFDAAEIEVHQL